MGIKLTKPFQVFFNQIDPPGNEPPAPPKKEEIKKESEEMPAWAKSLQTNLENLLKPKEELKKEIDKEQIIPAPKPPARKEEDRQEEPAKKKSFLNWLM